MAIRPVRHTNYSTELMTNVRGVHGFEGYCACGWYGSMWKEPSAARAEARWHYLSDHQDQIAAVRREEVSPDGRAEAS